MKKAEEYIPKLVKVSESVIVNNKQYFSIDFIIRTIKQVQLDTIDETVRLCATSATFIITEDAIIEDGTETNYHSDGVFTTRISSKSILNCAEILKKEL